ncbi:GTPase [Schlesneria sp.]|uniref:GTPase n=1 Tax=Schlesneria sp. TaxID=2762018 RepID=UPI002EF03E15
MTDIDVYSRSATRRTAARLTPGGRGAVATIRVAEGLGPEERGAEFQGIDPLFEAANGVALSQQPLRKIAFGRWGHSHREDLIVCRVSADLLEIHCHGGDSAVERILKDLEEATYQVVDWQTQLTISDDILQAECQETLSRTTTWRTTQIALEQAGGLLRQAFQEMVWTTDEATLLSRLDSLIRWSNFGLHLSNPWNVVLTGRPNVGKSSLINGLLGYERAIVFDQPGTTRDVVTGETAFEGWPVVLADTAGIRQDAHALESQGIALAQARLRTADLQIVLLDLSQVPTPDDFELLRQWPEALVVANKADLSVQWDEALPENVLQVSAKRGQGLAELQSEIVKRLVPEVPPTGTAVPLNPRQVAILQQARSAGEMTVRRAMLSKLLHGGRDLV